MTEHDSKDPQEETGNPASQEHGGDQPQSTQEENPSGQAHNGSQSSQDGPTFTEAPDPLASIKKGTSDVLDSMEGKTVSMKTYVGTIIGVIVLMMLARCGG